VDTLRNRILSKAAGRVALLALTMVAALACQAAPSPSSGGLAPLEVRNYSTVVVDVTVNGQTEAAVQPESYAAIQTADLPSPPWTVSAVASDGHVYGSFAVPSLQDLTGHGTRIDLSCGRVDMWIGQPLLGPTFIAGASGDC
jgi:hypothetical protein